MWERLFTDEEKEHLENEMNGKIRDKLWPTFGTVSEEAKIEARILYDSLKTLNLKVDYEDDVLKELGEC